MGRWGCKNTEQYHDRRKPQAKMETLGGLELQPRPHRGSSVHSSYREHRWRTTAFSKNMDKTKHPRAEGELELSPHSSRLLKGDDPYSAAKPACVNIGQFLILPPHSQQRCRTPLSSQQLRHFTAQKVLKNSSFIFLLLKGHSLLGAGAIEHLLLLLLQLLAVKKKKNVCRIKKAFRFAAMANRQ